MEKEFKEKVGNLREAQSTLTDANAKISSIAKKLEEAESLLPDLKKKTSKAEAEKEKILDRFALGSVNQAELDRAKKALEKAKTEETETGELIDALERVKGNLNREIPLLQNQVLSFERVVWSWILNREILNLKNLVGELLVKGFSAQSKTGIGDWRSFLEAVAGSIPDPAEVLEFQSSLAKEYGIVE